MAESAGFAYIPQAADWLASQTLRIPRVKSAGSSLLSKTTMPLTGHLNHWESGIPIMAENHAFKAVFLFGPPPVSAFISVPSTHRHRSIGFCMRISVHRCCSGWVTWHSVQSRQRTYKGCSLGLWPRTRKSLPLGLELNEFSMKYHS